MIGKHVNHLRRHDSDFRRYWDGIGASKRRHFLDLAKAADGLSFTGTAELAKAHREASLAIRHYLYGIRESERAYERRPDDWVDFVGDRAERQHLADHCKSELRVFLQGKIARFYGGLKPLKSLDRKLRQQSGGSNTNFRDMWDVVRYRVVVEAIPELRAMALEIWRRWNTDIVRSRNYYMHPKGDSLHDPYRAIHFELEIMPKRWVEVQLLTEARDFIGHMDFALLFKCNVPPMSPHHQSWMWDLSRKINILDAESVTRS